MAFHDCAGGLAADSAAAAARRSERVSSSEITETEMLGSDPSSVYGSSPTKGGACQVDSGGLGGVAE